MYKKSPNIKNIDKYKTGFIEAIIENIDITSENFLRGFIMATFPYDYEMLTFSEIKNIVKNNNIIRNKLLVRKHDNMW